MPRGRDAERAGADMGKEAGAAVDEAVSGPSSISSVPADHGWLQSWSRQPVGEYMALTLTLAGRQCPLQGQAGRAHSRDEGEQQGYDERDPPGCAGSAGKDQRWH